MIIPHPCHPNHLFQDPDPISRTFLEQFALVYNFYSRSIYGSTDELDDTTMPPLHPLSRQARQVQPSCSDPECQLTWTPVPNMGAALTGYNPVIGNSLSGDQPDPGAKQQIFVPTFQKSDGRLDVHDNIHFFNDVHCQVDTETKIVKSFRDYQSLKSSSWQLSRGSTESSSFNIPLLSLIANFGKKEFIFSIVWKCIPICDGSFILWRAPGRNLLQPGKMHSLQD